jgi:septum formation protein
MEIILASSSIYRKELLAKLGLNFKCIGPDIDEDIIKSDQNLDFQEKAIKLATEKANAIFKDHPNAIIIGSDQICHNDDKIFSKSESIEKSIDILRELSGKTHYLTTAYCIRKNEKTITHINKTTLIMRELSDLQIKNYLRLDKPIDCAGSYKLELNGISLFKAVKTDDYTGIIGLPIIQLGNDLEKLGCKIPSH